MTHPPQGPGRAWSGGLDDARLELRVRQIAPPVVFALAFLAYGSSWGQGVFRTFLSMWLHELGHAASAWLAGYGALPGPWRTAIPDERSVFVALLLFALVGYGAWRAWEARRWMWIGAAGVVALLHVLLLVLSGPKAHALITFFGDGGGMVLGTALVCTFFVEPGSKLHETWLRWGFLVIGAAGFMDPMRQWWRARHDLDAIPFGEIEGVGTSDPTRLVDDYGWRMKDMVSRYVTLGLVCAVVIAGVYAWGVIRARRRVAALR